MGITVDGNSIVITNARIEVVNTLNEETGVAYIIITPEGGLASMPFLAEGRPGQPTLFPSISLVEVNPLEALPSPNPAVVLIDAGGPGLPAKYGLTFYVHKGDKGDPGTYVIAESEDLATEPALGEATEKYVLIWRNSDSKWVPTSQRVGDHYVSPSISSTAFNATNPRLLSTISIPALPFDYRPLPYASTVITGSSDTRVDLVVRLNNASSGDQLGYGKGFTGANSTGIPTVLIPAYPTGSAVPGAYGKVSANTAATVHLRAEQKAASSNGWSTPSSPDTTFSVVIGALL